MLPGMKEAVAAIVGALVGAGAGILGAWINARSLRQQVRYQAVVEHGHWRRQNRSDAYTEFLGAAYDALRILERKRIEVEVSDNYGVLDFNALKHANNTLQSTSNKVLLAGPELVSIIAKQISGTYRVASDMLEADPVVPRDSEEWQAVGNNLFDLVAIFPLTARKVLDAAAPEDVPYPNDELPSGPDDGE